MRSQWSRKTGNALFGAKKLENPKWLFSSVLTVPTCRDATWTHRQRHKPPGVDEKSAWWACSAQRTTWPTTSSSQPSTIEGTKMKWWTKIQGPTLQTKQWFHMRDLLFNYDMREKKGDHLLLKIKVSAEVIFYRHCVFTKLELNMIKILHLKVEVF